MFVLKPTRRDYYILGVFLFVIGALVVVITNPILFSKSETPNFNVASPERLKEHVGALSNITPGRGYQDLDSLNEVARYIEGIFSEYCPTTTRQTFAVEGEEYSNIICSFNEEAAERLVVGAHYDSFNSLSGADDNASGVAGILELARMLKESTQATTNKRIDLVAYTLEEPPFFSSENMGSFKHAEQLRNEGADVEAVIILEMIGFFTDEPGSQTVPISILKPLYPDRGNFIAVIGKFGQGKILRNVKRNMAEVAAVEVRSFSAPPFIHTIDFSDHRSYWLHEYPAIMITDTAFYRNNNYHTEKDLPHTLDYARMAEAVNGVYWATVNY